MDKNVLKAFTSASIVTSVRKVNYKNDEINGSHNFNLVKTKQTTKLIILTQHFH